MAIADNLKQGMIKASFQVLQIKFMQCSGDCKLYIPCCYQFSLELNFAPDIGEASFVKLN